MTYPVGYLFRVIVTGSREKGVDPFPIHIELDRLRVEYGASLFIKVGDCLTGVDPIATEWCKANGVSCHVFDADWDRHGFKAGPIRNGNMVRSGGELCLAFNAGERPFKRTGTCDCSCQAADARIRVTVVPVQIVPAKGTTDA